MAEVTNELMFEVLKSVQSRLDTIDARLGDLAQELIAMRGAMLAMQTDIHNLYGMWGRHEQRLERIERRLELRELAEAQRPYEHEP